MDSFIINSTGLKPNSTKILREAIAASSPIKFNLVNKKLNSSFGSKDLNARFPKENQLGFSPSNVSGINYSVGSSDSEINQFCELNWVMMLSLPNKINSVESKIVQDYANMVAVLLFVFLFHIWRWKLRDVERKCDEKDLQADDFTVI